jgi:hypothetical protein
LRLVPRQPQVFPPDFAIGQEVKKLTYDALTPVKK